MMDARMTLAPSDEDGYQAAVNALVKTVLESEDARAFLDKIKEEYPDYYEDARKQYTEAMLDKIESKNTY
jgi:hypothetical protein